ncbi:calcium-binding and coiled-coil domain-containing protein 1b [Chanos chanos]|uniref:Calcium-binding and coiled-coil domain-containing protein 1b n=1 Tax=Chanos chanos TaxID=29144 RepID=A0A6J2VMB8_CHACN|nr:calcium-binding and coiled-coil domain-containing protein 1-like [Chanos chanos]
MEKPWKVKFRNVGRSYFPQTRVECHYSISKRHNWTSRDWIGLFKVGWRSVRQYYTFAWALVPEGYKEGTDADCCVHFHSFYLPNPGALEYQFVYVDENGKVRAISPQFTFCAPRPLDELVTLEEEKDGEEEEEVGEDLLLVVPKAQILQSQLETCQQDLKKLHSKLEDAEEELEREREESRKIMEDSEREKEGMRDEIAELRDNLRTCLEQIKKMEGKQKETQNSHETVSAELSGLWAEKAGSQQRIRELEEDMSALTLQKQEAEAELERMKDRIRKMSMQRREEEEERKNLQREAEAAHNELQTLQERLASTDLHTEALRRDLSELGTLQSHSHAELHQTRLQLAQVTLQLSQANLALREGQAAWAQEKEALRQNVELEKERIQKLIRELQKKEEWLQEERSEREKLEVELGKEKDCNRELRASLKVAQKEREMQQLETQELLGRIHELEQMLDTESDAKWSQAASTATAKSDSAPSVKDLKENPEVEPQTLADPQDKPDRPVDINQSSPLAPKEQREDQTLNTEMGEQDAQSDQKDSEDSPSLMPELTFPSLSGVTSSLPTVILLTTQCGDTEETERDLMLLVYISADRVPRISVHSNFTIHSADPAHKMGQPQK